MAQNGWNKVEQGWNRVWAIRMDHYDPFTALLNLKFGPQEVPNWVKMTKNAIAGLLGPWELEKGWNVTLMIGPDGSS